jgi:hypothetical protein
MVNVTGRIIEFAIGVSHTVNLGNFESMRIEASVTYQVGENDKLEALKLQAEQELTQLCRETYLAQRKPKQVPRDSESSKANPYP